MVLESSAINISAATLGFAATDAKLYYPDGTQVVYSAPAAKSEASPAVVPAGPAATDAPLIIPEVYIDVPAASADEVSSTPEVSEAPANTELAASAASSKAVLPLWTAFAGLGGIVGLGVASVMVVRRKPETAGAEDEFTIE